MDYEEMYGVCMKIIRWKHRDWKFHLIGILQGLGELADGLVTICSLGFFMSDFELSVSKMRAQHTIRSIKREHSERQD